MTPTCARAAALVIALATSPAAAEFPYDQLLDRTQGVIDGQGAAVVYPVEYDGDDLDKLVPVAGCVAHLAPRHEPEAETLGPCGAWFLPEQIGLQTVWAEGPGWISDHPSLVSWVGAVKLGFDIFVAAEPAGHLLLPAAPSEREQRFWLLRAESTPVAGGLGLAFERYVDAVETPTRAAMPVGKAIGGIWDPEKKRLLALSPVVDVRKGKATRLDFVKPGVRGDVLVRLDREAIRHSVDPDVTSFELILARGAGVGAARPADSVIVASDTVVAVWYGVPPGTWTLAGGSSLVGVVPTPFEVERGKVTRLLRPVVERPRLDVDLDLPADLDGEDLVLELQRLDGTVVGAEKVDVDAYSRTFESLPLEELRLVLRTSRGDFGETLDFRQAKSRRYPLTIPAARPE